MPKRPSPPRDLTLGFREAIGWHRASKGNGALTPMCLYENGPACWLHHLDPLGRPCAGELEAFHFLGRQRVRHALEALGFGAELVVLAEWDPRNAGPACTEHHRRFDCHATPALRIPVQALPLQTLGFILNWGLEIDAERKFDGDLDGVIEARIDQLEKHWGYQGAGV